VKVIRGISRHVVRFVEYDGALYALKELPERPARREYSLLRRLESQGLPVVEAVGLVTERRDDLDAVLITRHLEYSLPYRALFAGAAIFLTVLSINFIGDGLRDVLDPRKVM